LQEDAMAGSGIRFHEIEVSQSGKWHTRHILRPQVIVLGY
jgi:hypothetical protein